MNKKQVNKAKIVHNTLAKDKQCIYINGNIIVSKEISYGDIVYSISSDQSYVCAFEDTIIDIIAALQALVKNKTLKKKNKCKIIKLIPKY